MKPALAAAVLCLWFASMGRAQPDLESRPASSAASPKQGAHLLKTDVLGVFAHPDDESGVAATFARYALGEGKVVVGVYCTRGEGGGNMVGTQWGAALGVLRETELRDCLAILGVRSCFFLDRLDWAYTESVAATLHNWGKEETLERLVRLVRALRPDVIVTMNPAPTAGQHGHHQAAGVLATEAFAAAADPARFPLQLTREGLAPWQPRKLYFAGGGAGLIATITVSEPFPDGRTPAVIARQAFIHHRSQGFGNFSGGSGRPPRPQRFTLVRSFVPVGGNEDDLLSGLGAISETLPEVHFAEPPSPSPVQLQFIPRPAWVRYRQWVEEQGIEHVAGQFPSDLPLVAGEASPVRLRLLNTNDKPISGELTARAPTGWKIDPARQRVGAGAGASREIELSVTPPADLRADAELNATFTANGESFEARANGHLLPRARVARLRKAPALDGTDRGWEGVSSLAIAPSDLVQGKVTDNADSSATFRLGHDGTTLFMDVNVKDDLVVTNIAPNDIRGHWRGDSVEICMDPAVGAEDTLGCFKLGIFPFDTTGVVRAARDADANQGPMEETAPGTRVVSRRVVDGYRIQVAVPLREIGVSLDKSRRLGFNVIIYDGDKPNAALGENINKSRLAWAPRSGVNGRPEDWGRVDLE